MELTSQVLVNNVKIHSKASDCTDDPFIPTILISSTNKPRPGPMEPARTLVTVNLMLLYRATH